MRLPPPNHDRLLERHPHLRKPLKLLGRKVELRARDSISWTPTAGRWTGCADLANACGELEQRRGGAAPRKRPRTRPQAVHAPGRRPFTFTSPLGRRPAFTPFSVPCVVVERGSETGGRHGSLLRAWLRLGSPCSLAQPLGSPGSPSTRHSSRPPRMLATRSTPAFSRIVAAMAERAPAGHTTTIGRSRGISSR